MPWTTEQRIEALLRLPWTIQVETSPEGDRLLRVAELPSVVGCGADEQQREADHWASLGAAFEAYLHFGDPIPLPAGAALPWARERRPEWGSVVAAVIRRRQSWEGQSVPDAESTAAAPEWQSAVN
jgi:hypothetical protein